MKVTGFVCADPKVSEASTLTALQEQDPANSLTFQPVSHKGNFDDMRFIFVVVKFSFIGINPVYTYVYIIYLIYNGSFI